MDVLVGKPGLRKSRFFLKGLIGLSLLGIVQSAVHAEIFDLSKLNLHGTISYGYSFSRASELESQLNTLNLGINGSSVIWRPWFASMSAGIGLGTASSESNSDAESDFTSNSLSLNFALFPVSRFPFQLNYSTSRNEVSGFNDTVDGLISTSTVTNSTRLGLLQTYTTRDLMYMNFYFTKSDFESDFSNFTNNVAGFRVNKAYSKQRFSVDGNYINGKQNDVGTESSSIGLSATHNYFPSNEIGIASVVSHSNSKSDSKLSNSKSNADVNQVSSSVSWSPRHKPYSMSGGVRFAQSQSDSLLDKNETRSASTNATLSYKFNRQTRGNFTASVTASEAEGSQTLNASEIASIGFFSEPTTIGNFFYSWSVGASGSNTSSRIDGGSATPEKKTDSQSLGASFGHALNRSFVFNTANFHMGLSQNMSANKAFSDKTDPTPGVLPVEEPVDDISKSLSQSLNMGGNHYAWGGTSIMNFTVSDTRTLGDDGVTFQLASFQVSRNQGINRLSSASGNFYAQASRTDDPALPEAADTQKTAAINFSYQHSRVFGIFGMTYRTTLEQESLLSSGDSERGRISWTNGLAYRIGLLSAKLNARLVEAPDGERTLGVNFQATRSF